jgi:hypothetical protein
MRQWIVQHLRDKVVVREVQCETIHTYPWEVLLGEKKYIILSLTEDGKHPIYMSWAMFDNEALAINSAARDIRMGMERAKSFDIQELEKQVSSISIINLDKENAEETK